LQTLRLKLFRTGSDEAKGDQTIGRDCTIITENFWQILNPEVDSTFN